MKNNPQTTSGNDVCRSNQKCPVQRISSETLLARENRLLIEHRGVDYLLQLTRQGKLILTK